MARGEEPPGKERAPAPVSYWNEIRPLFQEHCQGCHQPANARGKFIITSLEGLGKETRKGFIIAAGRPDESLLVKLITPGNGSPPKMPRDRDPLSSAQVELIRRWIAGGARDDSPPSAGPEFTRERPPVYTKPAVLTSLDFSPNGELLAVSGYHEVLLFREDGSGPVSRLVGLSERIESVSFSPRGKYLAVTGGSPARAGEVQIWDVKERELKLSISVTRDTVRGASWSPDGSLVAFGCADNTVRAIEVQKGRQVLYQGAHNDWVLGTVFSGDASHLVTVSRDGSMKLIQVKTQQFIDNITSITPGALKGGLAALDRHPGKDHLLAGGSDGIPRIYQMYRTRDRKIGDDYNLIRKFDPLPGRIFSARFSPRGDRIAVGSSLDGTGEIRLYGSGDGKLAWSRSFQGAVYAIAFHPGGKVLAAGGFDGRVRLLEAGTGKVLKEFLPVEISPPASTPGIPGAVSTASSVSSAEPGDGAPREALPEGLQLQEIEVFPRSIELENRFAYRQVLLTGRLGGGEGMDVTRVARVKDPAGLVQVSGTGLVRPLKDGAGELTFQVNDHSVTVPVAVRGQKENHPISFTRDVMPVLSRMGCNGGTCHGAAKGKNGFKLSLRGYDPVQDHRALIDDLAGRRFNRAAPKRSLFLLKPSGGVPHTGGVLFRPGEPHYEILRSWIAQGVKLDGENPRVCRIEVIPGDLVLPLPGAAQQFAVMATYSDGRTRDVTNEAFLKSNNTEVAGGEWSRRFAAARPEFSPGMRGTTRRPPSSSWGTGKAFPGSPWRNTTTSTPWSTES